MTESTTTNYAPTADELTPNYYDALVQAQPRLQALAARNVSPQVAGETLARLEPGLSEAERAAFAQGFVASVEAVRAAMPEDRTLPLPDEHYIAQLVEMGETRANAEAMFALGKDARLHGGP